MKMRRFHPHTPGRESYKYSYIFADDMGFLHILLYNFDLNSTSISLSFSSRIFNRLEQHNVVHNIVNPAKLGK